jgi:hypothetical protein
VSTAVAQRTHVGALQALTMISAFPLAPRFCREAGAGDSAGVQQGGVGGFALHPRAFRRRHDGPLNKERTMYHRQRVRPRPAAYAPPRASLLPSGAPLTPAQQAQLPGGTGPQFLEIRDRQERLQVIRLAAATWPALEAAREEWQRKQAEASRCGFKGATQQALQGQHWHGQLMATLHPVMQGLPTLTVAEACERLAVQAAP